MQLDQDPVSRVRVQNVPTSWTLDRGRDDTVQSFHLYYNYTELCNDHYKLVGNESLQMMCLRLSGAV